VIKKKQSSKKEYGGSVFDWYFNYVLDNPCSRHFTILMQDHVQEKGNEIKRA
jgi:hypothetical protein